MATCVKCDGSTFKLEKSSPQLDVYYVLSLMLVRCSKCGAVAGVVDPAVPEIHRMVKEQGELLKKISKKIDMI